MRMVHVGIKEDGFLYVEGFPKRTFIYRIDEKAESVRVSLLPDGGSFLFLKKICKAKPVAEYPEWEFIAEKQSRCRFLPTKSRRTPTVYISGMAAGEEVEIEYVSIETGKYSYTLRNENYPVKPGRPPQTEEPGSIFSEM